MARKTRSSRDGSRIAAMAAARSETTAIPQGRPRCQIGRGPPGDGSAAEVAPSSTSTESVPHRRYPRVREV